MIEKLVLQIEHDNDKAENIQEEQDDMIDAYRCAYLCAGRLCALLRAGAMVPRARKP